MNKELKTKLVLASVLAGFSTMASAIPTTAMNTEMPAVSPVRQEVVVSKAARKAIDGKVQEAKARPRPWEQDSGPKFVQSRPWSGQMKLPVIYETPA